mmetsp:Transcript_30133/g.65786  ORF Transcript_30133/g.65786 Transcript_30133/m.65786 type:complete len:557 (-) Transcript_30133:1137-2807(-)
MEAGRAEVVPSHGAETIGRLQREVWVLHQGLHARQQVLGVGPCLHAEPFVQHVGVALCVCVETLESFPPLRSVFRQAAQVAQGRCFLGHPARVFIVPVAQCSGLCTLLCHEVGQADVPQPTSARAGSINCVLFSFFRAQLRVARHELLTKLAAEDLADVIPCLVKPERINRRLRDLQQRRVRRQGQRVREQAEVLGGSVRDGPSHGLHECRRGRVALHLRSLVCVKNCLGAQTLHGLPPVEGVRVISCQERQLFLSVGVLQHHRGREIPEQRRNWRLRDVGGHLELEGLTALSQLNERVAKHLLARGAVEEPHSHGDVHRKLVLLAWGVRNSLRQRQGVGLLLRIPGALDGDGGCASLQVPTLELCQVATVGVCHCCAEVIAGDSAPVVALEVEVHSFSETVTAQEGLVHADDLSALVVDRGRVEVVDRGVLLRPDGVGHWACILGKLECPEYLNVLNALPRTGLDIRGELLIPIDSEPLFQRQLEPVPACDTVPRPIVEVLVSNDPFDALIVVVGGCVWPGQCKRGVEDVETFVFHRAHVEVTHGNNVVDVEVVL